MIEYHNPEASTSVEATPYELSLSVTWRAGLKLGLLANGFPDSESFLEELGLALKELEPGVELMSFNKGNASIAAGEELLAEVTQDCVGVIAAYGH